MEPENRKSNYLTATFTDAEVKVIESVMKKTKKSRSVILHDATMKGIKELS